LEKKRLREREFGQFFTPELARHFVRHPELLKEGREAEVTVMFCDIRGFSKISEQLKPSETVDWVSDIMAVLSDCVIEHRGVLVDYIGDELMAMWGAPERQPDHAELSCKAAIAMLHRLPELSARWQSVTEHPTKVGIGLNTGLAQVGNTGSHRKFKYGPLGNTVNIASRVQGATKYLQTGLVVTGTTCQQLGPHFATRRLCKARVVNIDQPIDLYEVLSCDQDRDITQLRRYEEALEKYETQEFRPAASILGNLLVESPNDGASLMLMYRVVDALLRESAQFDPVWELPGK
jgi:adenylate cyclase